MARPCTLVSRGPLSLPLGVTRKGCWVGVRGLPRRSTVPRETHAQEGRAGSSRGLREGVSRTPMPWKRRLLRPGWEHRGRSGREERPSGQGFPRRRYADPRVDPKANPKAQFRRRPLFADLLTDFQN